MWCMMKVYLKNIPNNSLAYENKEQSTFRAKPSPGKIGNDIAKKSKWLPKALTYIGQHDGEILNTVVTAAGTSIVAPIFIAGNPFSKEDKETKWYSALRQPISAVIALVVQLWINDKFNGWMDKMGSTGAFGPEYDLRAMPKANYLKKIIKLEHPEFTKEEVQAEIVRRQNQAEKKVVAQMRLEMKDKAIEYKELLSKDALDGAKKNLVEDLQKQYESELAGKSDSAVEKFIKKKITPEMIEEKALSNIQKTVEAEAKAKFQIRELAKKFNNLDDAIKHMTEQITANPADEKIFTNVIERLEKIKVYEEANGMKAFSSIKDLGKTYEKVLHNVKIKKLVKARTSDAQKALSKGNKQLGIIVSLVTLPFSCGLLNWAYPRIMEKVMPKIQPWIHRNDPDWTPEKAKKYGPPEKITKAKVEKEDDNE